MTQPALTKSLNNILKTRTNQLKDNQKKQFSTNLKTNKTLNPNQQTNQGLSHPDVTFLRTDTGIKITSTEKAESGCTNQGRGLTRMEG